TDPSTDSFKVWSSFRVIGNIVLVIGMLVIVFGQSLGGGLIDAYTAKKILPRIIVAAILINLSVYFVAIAVDVSNIVGKGIQQLMFAPFVASGMSNFSLSGTQIAVGVTPLAIMGGLLAGAGAISAGASAGAGIGAALVTLGTAIWPMIGLFVILPAILALIAVFATLILRRALILFLVIVSPIAFALYCLPNTEKYFKKWWELFFKALLVYPIIAVMFALADILALTLLSANGATNSNAVENGLAIVIAFVIQLIPLFVIPFSFKLAGGVIGNLYGTLSGFGKKSGEAIKGNPNDQNSVRNRFKRDFNTKRLNAGLSAGMVGTALNPSLLTRAGRERGRARFVGARVQGLEAERKAFEGSAGWKTAENDSNVTGALAYFESGDAARQGIDFWEEKERQKILSNRSFGVTERNEAFQTLARQREQKMAAVGIAEKLGYNKANRKAALMNAGTIGFETDGGKEGWEQATTAMRSIAGGDAMQYRSMMDEFQYVAKSQAGRADLAANVDGNDAYDLDRATGSQSLYQLLNSKPKTVAALIDEHQARIWDSSASDAERQKSAQFLHEMSNASTKGQGSAGVRDEINAKMGDMNTALDAYTYAQAMSGAPLPTSRDEVVRVSEPDPITGGTVTRVVSRPVTLGSRAEQVAEAQRKARGVIADESRAYVPPDPNNMP
ncbi:hypothetical protein KA047_03945, partial [Candidatus Saccharibacteria bacterium]|nr:hypothetical protein [Candidatus Saccharibacteria bacterium]